MYVFVIKHSFQSNKLCYFYSSCRNSIFFDGHFIASKMLEQILQIESIDFTPKTSKRTLMILTPDKL